MFWDWIKENRNRNKYISQLDEKYRRFTNSEKADILSSLMRIQAGDEASKRARRTPPGEAQMDLLIQAIAGSDIKAQVEREYRIEIIEEYIAFDIEFLQ